MAQPAFFSHSHFLMGPGSLYQWLLLEAQKEARRKVPQTVYSGLLGGNKS